MGRTSRPKRPPVRMCDQPDPGADAWSPNQIGVEPTGYCDGGPTGWSWACKCGAWDDLYRTRSEARRSYRYHKKVCTGEDLRAERATPGGGGGDG